MRACQLIALAVFGLRRRPLRVALTVLGVAIAAAALLSMVGFALGIQRQAEAPFEKLDLLKNIEVWVKRSNDSGDDPLVLDDALLAEIESMPGVDMAYPEFRMFNTEISLGEKRQRCVAVGTPRELGLVGTGGEMLIAGDFFHLSGDEPQVLITMPTVEALGLESADHAVGATVALEASGLARRDDEENTFEYRTEKLEATVVGVYQLPNPVIGSFARPVLVPTDLIKDLPGASFGRRGPPGPDGADGPPRGYARVIVRVEHPTDLTKVEKRLKQMGLATQTIIGRLDELRTFFVFVDVLLAAVGTVALVVAALGIVNTLLMAVLERYQEIGTYKAIGASDGDIVLLFLTEAVLLGFFGGLGGVLIGRVVSWLLGIAINIYAQGQGVQAPLDLFSFPLWLCVAAIGFATSVAALAGAYPALRAARVDPIQALRGE